MTRDNYVLFTPMLHEVAASDLELHTIVSPLRKLLNRVRTFVAAKTDESSVVATAGD